MSVCLCLSNHFYSCVLHNCTHFTAKYSQKMYFALIYVLKNVHFTAEVRFYGACGVCGVRAACVVNSGIQEGINKFSSKLFSIFYDNIAVLDLLSVIPLYFPC